MTETQFDVELLANSNNTPNINIQISSKLKDLDSMVIVPEVLEIIFELPCCPKMPNNLFVFNKGKRLYLQFSMNQAINQMAADFLEVSTKNSSTVVIHYTYIYKNTSN